MDKWILAQDEVNKALVVLMLLVDFLTELEIVLML